MAVSEFLADTLLIEAAKEAGMLLKAGEDAITSRLRGIINREQRLHLSALLRKAREGYLEDSATIATVAGTTRYRLPTRAVAAAVSLVEEVTGSTTRILVPLSRKGAAGMEAQAGVGDFYFDDNYLVLVATPSVAGSIRLAYQRRLNKVVAATAACVVTGINTVTKAVTMVLASDGATATLPTTFTSSATYDFVRGTPHFDVLGKDLAATVAANVLTFAATLPTELAVGDFVALAGQTPVANVPLELQDVLVLRAVYLSLAGNGDPQTGAWKALLDEAEADALVLMSPRAKETPPTFQNLHAPGYNRMRNFRRYGGG